MRTLLRTLIIGTAALLGLTATAQYPYTLIVQGTVAGCTPFQQVTVTTTGNTSPSYSWTLEVFPPNCSYDTVLHLNSGLAGVVVSTLCNGMVVNGYDSVAFNFIGDTAVMTIDLSCSGGTLDCLGIINGPNVAGAPCNDGDPNTINDTWDANCICAGVQVYTCIVQGQVQNCTPGQLVGVTVNQGSFNVFNSPLAVDANCEFTTTWELTSLTAQFVFHATVCGQQVNLPVFLDNTAMSDTIYLPVDFLCGLTLDCNGVPNGPDMPGTSCNDNDPLTVNDVWSANCICAGTAPQNCQASFTVSNSSPWVIDLWNTSTGQAPMLYGWQVSNGAVSAQNSPFFMFSGPGTYGICLTIAAANMCTSTFCDTVYVDSIGNVTAQPNYYDCMGYPNGTNLPGTPCQIPGTILFGTWDMNCLCDTTTLSVYDCTGILNGPNMPGTACVDTVGGVLVTGTWQANCICVTNALNDCLGIFNGPNMPGTPCNDGDTLTVQDTWTPTCQCVGVPVNYYDCLQIINGPNLPGTPCNDNDPGTIGDTWDANCDCIGSVPQPCNASFWVLQGYTVDSITNLPVPIPNELWVWNLSSGGTGAFSFLWSFGDGTSSTDPFPTHVYASGGPYNLCLTINDSAGCTSTYCDSVSVDANGMYTGIMGGGNDRQSGFTLNVRDPLATGVQEVTTTLGELALWPNPVQDMLNIALVSDLRESVTVDLIDLNGRVVRSERHALGGGRSQLALSTAGLDAGLYILRIGNGTTTISQRFVKMDQ